MILRSLKCYFSYLISFLRSKNNFVRVSEISVTSLTIYTEYSLVFY